MDEWKHKQSAPRSARINLNNNRDLKNCSSKLKQINLEVNLDLKSDKTNEGKRPALGASAQVYLAIFVTLSCPFYAHFGMSAAISRHSNPRFFFLFLLRGGNEGSMLQTRGAQVRAQGKCSWQRPISLCSSVWLGEKEWSQRLTTLSLVWHVVVVSLDTKKWQAFLQTATEGSLFTVTRQQWQKYLHFLKDAPSLSLNSTL